MLLLTMIEYLWFRLLYEQSLPSHFGNTRMGTIFFVYEVVSNRKCLGLTLLVL